MEHSQETHEDIQAAQRLSLAQVRSFQYAIERLKGKPQLANLLIHKPGSLADEAAHLAELADVYRRGLGEVAQLIDGAEARPS